MRAQAQPCSCRSSTHAMQSMTHESLTIGDVAVRVQQAEQVVAHVLRRPFHAADQQPLQDPVRVPAHHVSIAGMLVWTKSYRQLDQRPLLGISCICNFSKGQTSSCKMTYRRTGSPVIQLPEAGAGNDDAVGDGQQAVPLRSLRHRRVLLRVWPASELSVAMPNLQRSSGNLQYFFQPPNASQVHAEGDTRNNMMSRRTTRYSSFHSSCTSSAHCRTGADFTSGRIPGSVTSKSSACAGISSLGMQTEE